MGGGQSNIMIMKLGLEEDRIRSQRARCSNEPEDSKLSFTAKVIEKFGIGTRSSWSERRLNHRRFGKFSYVRLCDRR